MPGNLSPNLTPLRLGMKATFDGKEYELRARFVLSVVEEGQTWYWEEFEMVAGDGSSFFLEFEIDDGVHYWKRTELFEPLNPLTAEQANQLHVDSRIDLEGKDALVTKYNTFCVEGFEGSPSWEVELNRPRAYLDAERGDLFYAVEWDNMEVEHYRGQRLDARDVFLAFGLTEEVARLDAQRRWARIGVAGVAALFLFVFCCGIGSELFGWNGHGPDFIEFEEQVEVRLPPPFDVHAPKIQAANLVMAGFNTAAVPFDQMALPLILKANEGHLIEQGMPIVIETRRKLVPNPSARRGGSGGRWRFWGGGK